MSLLHCFTFSALCQNILIFPWHIIIYSWREITGHYQVPSIIIILQSSWHLARDRLADFCHPSAWRRGVHAVCPDPARLTEPGMPMVAPVSAGRVSVSCPGPAAGVSCRSDICCSTSSWVSLAASPWMIQAGGVSVTAKSLFLRLLLLVLRRRDG